MGNSEENKEKKGRYRTLVFIKGKTYAKEKDLDISEGEIATWPYLMRKELLAAIICTIVLIVWSILFNAPLEELSDPTMTPNPAKAPWYFLGLQEMLVYFDPWIAGVVFPMLIIAGLMIIPYVDFNPKGNGYFTFKETKFAMLTFCFGFHILWILLIIVGVFMRGPGWLWFWPWQEWDPHRVVAETNYDLTSFAGVKSDSFLGFMLGGAVVFGYFYAGISLPYRFLKRGKNMAIEKLGFVKYTIVAFLFLCMMALPIKVFLRLALHIKYIWVTPWFNI
ncbi:MAG: cytochrome C [Candidatus Kuenenia sp.]|nr:cytochrome C [Candidatus Kuenenia hertensis]